MIDAKEARRVARLVVRDEAPAFIAAAEAAIEAAANQGLFSALIQLNVQGRAANVMLGVLRDHLAPMGYEVTMVGGPGLNEALVTW